MQKTLLSFVAVLSLTALTSVSHAAHQGAYAGLGLGLSKQETSQNLDLAPKQVDANSPDALGYKDDRDK